MGLTAAIAPWGLANNAFADKKFGDFSYDVKDSAVTITGFRQEVGGPVVIPAKIEGKPVTKIGDYAFYYCRDVTEVTIPGGVTKIGMNAFSNCSKLKKIELPASLEKFGTDAFANTDLRSVKIPAGVETISARAFVGCFRLNNVEISNGVRVIESQAFGYCSRLETVSLPESISNVTTESFAEAYLKEISVAAGNRRYSSADGIIYTKDHSRLISCPAQKSGAVKIPEGVRRLDMKSFYGVRRMTSVKLPKGLLSIEARAFDECNDLQEVNLPDGLTDIGHHAFVHTRLATVTIPATVDRIGGYAFVYSRNIKNVYFKGDAPALMGGNVFDSTSLSGEAVEGLTIYFYEGSEGFTEPTWMGYNTVAINPETPAANRLLFGSQWNE